MGRRSLGRGPGPWKAVRPKGWWWGGEERNVLQDYGFGSIPIAFPLWEKCFSDCPLHFQHSSLPLMLPCLISSIPGHWCLLRAPALS